jgi:hypothetical protein
MRDFIGAKNRPFVSESKKKYLIDLIKNNCCVCLENIPIDTTHIQLDTLAKYVEIDLKYIYFPFNLLTQQQLSKAYLFVADEATAKLLVSRMDDTKIYNKTINF